MKSDFFRNVVIVFVMYTITLFPSNQKQRYLLQQPAAPAINLSASGLHEVSFSVHLNGISASEKKIGGISYDRLSIPDCEFMMKEGVPQLPVISKLIAIPECDNITVKISTSSEMDFLNYNILPAPKYIKQKLPGIGEDLIPVLQENRFSYSISSEFPGKYGEIIETGYIRNQKVVRINLYPVQYNAVSKIIKVYADINVSLSFINPKSDVNKEAGIFRNMIHHTLLNYKPSGISALTKLTSSSNNKGKGISVVSLSGSENRITNLNLLTGNNAIPVDYLIITHSSLFNSSSLTKLANHRKNYYGYDVAIVKADNDIYNSYPASHHYESIRNFIRDVF